jgi:hypothetical protein
MLSSEGELHEKSGEFAAPQSHESFVCIAVLETSAPVNLL